MSDHEDHDPMHVDQDSPEDEAEFPYYLGESAGNVDNVEYPDYTMEEEEPVQEEEDGLLIGTLYFTNGLSQDTTEIKIFAGREIIVGREEDPNSCQFIIADFCVSKKHFRIYSIIYEQSELDRIQPLIYCEDLESTNGTFVNDECVGKAGTERRGHLLIHGDVIEIKPHWKYYFQQQHKPPETDDGGFDLRDLQYFSERYSVTNRLLGSGQYGKVYLAKELLTSRQVACKIINLKDAENDAMASEGTLAERNFKAKSAREKLFREVAILGKLSHPHIMDLRKAFCSNNFIYMFTELAPAGDLFSYCDARGGKLVDVEARVICRQIALALEYMHKKHIAHRDVKKENVLIMQTYQFSCRVVLTDFGFANHLDPRTRRMMSKVGTDDYAAPEVEAVDQTSVGYTLAADMYSLGKLTLNMLYGDTSSISRDVYCRQSQENVELFTKALKIDGLTNRANKFLRGLLHQDPTKRMNIHQALQHSWFKMPQREAIAMGDAFKRINKYWKHREEFHTIIEDLPDRRALLQGPSFNSGTKIRRRLPEVNPYPFVGLDSRLNPRVQSSRATVLQGLKEKNSLFVIESPEKSNTAADILRKKKTTKIKTVPGNDIFGLGSLSSVAEGDGSEYSEDEFSPTAAGVAEYSLQGGPGTSNDDSANSLYSDIPRSGQIERQPRSTVEAEVIPLRPNRHGDGFSPDELAKIPRHGNAKTYGFAIRNIVMRKNP